jgi:hypothetical protein
MQLLRINSMRGSRFFSQLLSRCCLGGLVASGLLAAVADSWAGPLDGRSTALLYPVSATGVVTNDKPAAPTVESNLDLATCKALALQKQPAIAAAQASLAAAIARQQALENLCVPTFLQRDLPKRRQQAGLGVTVGQASVLQAEIDTTYAVQFAYISYQYAHIQNRLVQDILAQVNRLESEIKKAVPADAAMHAKVYALRLLVRGRQAEAVVGMERALSSLREAIGLDDCLHVPLLSGLPHPSAKPDCLAVVQLALTRRPEIIQASIGTEVTDLEISAQRARLLALSVWTFAAGSDLHVNALPTSSFSPGYRPGAVGPEMPVTINGKRNERVDQASIYHGRACDVLEKTRNLIRLETEQAYLRWKEASAKLAEFAAGVEQARKALPDLEKEGTIPQNAGQLTSFLDSARLVTDLRLELNRAHYDMLIALIALERATAGGFCPGLDKAPIAVESSRK